MYFHKAFCSYKVHNNVVESENKMSNKIKKKIIDVVSKSDGKGIAEYELRRVCRVKRSDRTYFAKTLNSLLENGEIVKRKGRYHWTKPLGGVPATIARLNGTFGFAKTDEGNDVFIPGFELKGAMLGDKVLIKKRKSDRGEEGKVLAIIGNENKSFSGVIVEHKGRMSVIPDKLQDYEMKVDRKQKKHYNTGEKVLVSISKRGQRHSDHRVMIEESYGDSFSAFACTNALIDAGGIVMDFPETVMNEANNLVKKGIAEQDYAGREDFRDQAVFTIDSADSKDLDDAISLEKTSKGYILGVHIADVSHYVKGHGAIDKEAFDRGTSVYFADRVIPMLPTSLSNGICSLNPNEDRLTFSAIITLNNKGEMTGFDFKKSVISSRVKGVYKEINEIILNVASDEIMHKYTEVLPNIKLMNELADKLVKLRGLRNAPEIDTMETKIITEDNKAVDVLLRERGKSERIIEEFMLLANEAAAKFAQKAELPFVYRIHESPSLDRVSNLKEVLGKLGLSGEMLTDGKNPAELTSVLKKVEGTDLLIPVNRMVLRTMAKAIYSERNLGHYGLALSDYAHFTSPIRRYPDLTIHRILSEFLQTKDAKAVTKKYREFVVKSARNSSETEVAAASLERECDDIYIAEYMKQNVGKKFEATITGATASGIFATLGNGVEGKIKVTSMPEGHYEFDGNIRLTETLSGQTYTIGDKINVKCTKININLGQIDFDVV